MLTDDVRQIYHYPDGTATNPLTIEEARKAGFCPGCGWFVAGSEYEDQSLHNFGLCTECVDEIRDETGEYDSEFDDDYS
jgi:hypothetical protein